MPRIRELNDADKYLALGQTVATATTLDEVRRACAAAAAPPTSPAPKKKATRGRRPKT